MTISAEDLEKLYASEHRRLEAQIYRKTGSAATARDLVHDIFLRFWEKAERLAFSPAYRSRCARNAAIDHLRAERTRTDFANRILPAQYSAPSVSPLQELEAKDGMAALEAVIRAFPERTRHIYLLNRVHGRPYREIAEALDISVSAVEKHMARAVLALRDALT